jgi:stage V sporulation protein AD
MANGKLSDILFLGTGAMMSPASLQQGEAIPGIAHLIRLTANNRIGR